MATEYNLVTFNIANALNDEKSETFRFAKRLTAVITEIKKGFPDVLCLQELRDCKSLDDTSVLTAMSILMEIMGETGLMIAAMERVGPIENPMWRATLYNPTKLFHLGSRPHWLNAEKQPTVPGTNVNGSLAMILESKFAQFTPITRASLRKSDGTCHPASFMADVGFSVFNAHFPIEKRHRVETSEFVRDLSATHRGEIYFVVGDMNTFFDDGGDEMMQIMQSGGLVDFLPPGTKTFKSFPHDSFQTVSTLDHLFGSVSLGYQVINCRVFDSVDYEVCPSDHFMCTLQFSL